MKILGKISKPVMFATRSLALVVGLAVPHVLKIVGVELPKLVNEGLPSLGLIWLGIGDAFWGWEHRVQAKAEAKALEIAKREWSHIGGTMVLTHYHAENKF